MTRLGQGVAQAFHVAAAELGLCSAAWLFVREVADEGGDALVEELRDLLGRQYPVLDAVAAGWLAGTREPLTDPAPAIAAVAGANRLLVVGIETAFLDALVPRLIWTEVSLLTHGAFETDWDRVVSNYGGRLHPVDIASFQKLAGGRSALLTFVYGVQGETTWVDPAWLRVMGPDVRTQFRSIIGWNVLSGVLYVYPRWLCETSIGDFSQVVP